MDTNGQTWADYRRDLVAGRKSPRTIEAYRYAFRSLAEWAAGRDVLSLAKADILQWLTDLQDGHESETVHTYYRRARTFYAWAEAEELLPGANPMARIKPPATEEKLIVMPTADDIRAVLAAVTACKPRDFASWRDEAMIRLFCEPGAPRVSAMASLTLAQIDLNTDTLTFRDKGEKWRTIPISAKTARALSRYLRARPRHTRAGERDELFLGKRGPMTRDGIYQMLERRCAEAGVARIHPHAFRHFTTHHFLKRGGGDHNIMMLNGWTSTQMLRRYGAAAAAERAAAAAVELSMGNEL
jgi:site-specific recombinase XerD